MPIAVNCLQGRTSLPEREWRLPGWLGWTVDLIALAYISLTTVLFLFPPVRQVTASNMSKFPRIPLQGGKNEKQIET